MSDPIRESGVYPMRLQRFLARAAVCTVRGDLHFIPATDVGTVLDGKHAVREGLIDSLGGLSDAELARIRLISPSSTRGKR